MLDSGSHRGESDLAMLAQVGSPEEMTFFDMKPDEIMKQRWLNTLQKSVPEVDLDDVNALLDDPQAGRQFAAEYSQTSYTHMLSQEVAIGDYVA